MVVRIYSFARKFLRGEWYISAPPPIDSSFHYEYVTCDNGLGPADYHLMTMLELEERNVIQNS